MSPKEYQEARARIDNADDMFGDLPDGAYWAACKEVGADMFLQVEVDEYEKKHGLGVYAKEKKK